MASAGTVTVLIKAVDKTKTALSKAESGFKKFTEKVKSLSMIQYGAVAGLAFGLSKIVMGASDINEAVNKTKVVFEDASKSVIDWAMKQANAWGMTRDEALDYAGSLGALLKSTGLTSKAAADMTLKLEKVAADMASIYNLRGGVAEALDKIKSGLVGMSIPLREVGILLSDQQIAQKAMKEGLIKSSKELTQQQKVLLRYQEILKQSTILQGDFQRTSKDLANSTRILKAEIQDSLKIIAFNFLPVIKDFVLLLRGVIELFGKLPMAVQTAVASLAGLITVVRMLGFSLASLGPTGWAVMGGLAALAGIFVYLQKVMHKTSKELDDFQSKIEGMSNEEIIAKYDELKKKQDEFKEQIKQLSKEIKEDTQTAFFGLIKTHEKWETSLKENKILVYKNKLKEISDELKVLEPRYKTAKNLVDQLNNTLGKIPETVQTTLSIKTDFSDLDVAEEWLNKFIEDEKRANKQAIADVYGYMEAFKGVFDTAHKMALNYVSLYGRIRSKVSKINYDAEIKDRINSIRQWIKAEQAKLDVTKSTLKQEESFSQMVTSNMAFSIKNLIADEAIGWVDKAWERSFGKANSLLQQFAKAFIKVLVQASALSLVKGLFKGIGLAIPFQTGGIITAQTGYSVGADTVPILASPGEAIIPAESVTQNRIEVQNLIYGNTEEKQDIPQNVRMEFNFSIQAWDGTDVVRVVNSDEFREGLKKAISGRNLNFHIKSGKLELI